MWGDFFLLMEGKILLAQKIKRIREMLAGGRYKEILCRTLLHFVPHRLTGKIIKNAKYLYLRSKYKKFIEQHRKESTVRKESGHENIIWWCWLQGLDNAPEICRVCLESLRRWHPEKKNYNPRLEKYIGLYNSS